MLSLVSAGKIIFDNMVEIPITVRHHGIFCIHVLKDWGSYMCQNKVMVNGDCSYKIHGTENEHLFCVDHWQKPWLSMFWKSYQLGRQVVARRHSQLCKVVPRLQSWGVGNFNPEKVVVQPVFSNLALFCTIFCSYKLTIWIFVASRLCCWTARKFVWRTSKDVTVIFASSSWLSLIFISESSSDINAKLAWCDGYSCCRSVIDISLGYSWWLLNRIYNRLTLNC